MARQRLLLFGQQKFPKAGQTQRVFFALVLDHQRPLTAQKGLAADAALWSGRAYVRGHGACSQILIQSVSPVSLSPDECSLLANLSIRMYGRQIGPRVR